MMGTRNSIKKNLAEEKYKFMTLYMNILKVSFMYKFRHSPGETESRTNVGWKLGNHQKCPVRN